MIEAPELTGEAAKEAAARAILSKPIQRFALYQSGRMRYRKNRFGHDFILLQSHSYPRLWR